MHVKLQDAELFSLHCNLYLPAKSKNWLSGNDYHIYLFSLPLNVHNVTRVTDLKLQSPKQTQDSCCPLSLANTAQRTLSAKWDAIKEEAHFLYYSLLNLGFLKQHLEA